MLEELLQHFVQSPSHETLRNIYGLLFAASFNLCYLNNISSKCSLTFFLIPLASNLGPLCTPKLLHSNLYNFLKMLKIMRNLVSFQLYLMILSANHEISSRTSKSHLADNFESNREICLRNTKCHSMTICRLISLSLIGALIFAILQVPGEWNTGL